jgi:hypothetical protein
MKIRLLNESTGNAASARLEMVNNAGSVFDFGAYGTGHSNASFAGRASINAYDPTPAIQIMADKSDAFFRMSLGTGSLSGSAETNERFRVTTTYFNVGDAAAAKFRITTATGTTILASGAQLGVGGTPAAGIAFLAKNSLAVDNTMQIQNTDTSGASAIDFLSSAGAVKGTWGYGNTGAYANALYEDRMFFAHTSTDFAIVKGGPGPTAPEVFVRDSDSHVGIGTASPTSLFSVGSSSQFQVDGSGNIVKLNNVTTSFPAANAAGALVNDGSGNFSYATRRTATANSTTQNLSVTGLAGETDSEYEFLAFIVDASGSDNQAYLWPNGDNTLQTEVFYQNTGAIIPVGTDSVIFLGNVRANKGTYIRGSIKAVKAGGRFIEWKSYSDGSSPQHVAGGAFYNESSTELTQLTIHMTASGMATGSYLKVWKSAP